MKFIVTKQIIRPDGIQPQVVSNSVDFVSCKFRFSAEWENLVKVALFTQGGNTYAQLLDDDGGCMLPVEIKAGQCNVSVYGQEAGGTVTVATNWYTITVVEAGYYGEAVVPTPDLYSQLLEDINTATEQTAQDVSDAKIYAENAKSSEESAEVSAKTATEMAEQAEVFAENASVSEGNAKTSEENAGDSETVASQALADLLAMINSGDIPLLVDGLLPLAVIPATATTEVYVVTDEEDLTSLIAQRGDLAQLVEDVDGVATITKSWQLLGDDATVAEDWIVWGTSYAVRSAYADTAGEASNSNTINNKRIVGMDSDQFDSAVLDDDTFYFVYDDDEAEGEDG